MEMIEKYGVRLRPVIERDAEFILSLRTDQQRSRYISSTDNSLGHQVEWIRQYKIRESEGLEYYFVAEDLDGVAFATFRIYPWEDGEMEMGSWVSKPNYDKPWNVFRILMVMKFYIFSHLQLRKIMYRIKKGNTSVVKFALWGGFIPFKEDEEFFYYYVVYKELKNKQLERYFEKFGMT